MMSKKGKIRCRHRNQKKFVYALLFVVTFVWYVVLFIALLVITVKVKADSFYPSGDILRCHFVPALAVGISQLPYVTTMFQYNTHLVRGDLASSLQNKNILDFVDVRRGRVQRYDKAHSVAVPPGAKLQFWFYGYNFAGHNVHVYSFGLGKPGNGMLGDVLAVDAGTANVQIIYASRRHRRDVYFLNKHVECKAYGNPSTCKAMLGEFVVKEPLHVRLDPIDCDFSTKRVKVHVCVTNIHGVASEAVEFKLVNTASPLIKEHAMIKPKQKVCKVIETSIKPEALSLEVLRRNSDFICLAHKDLRGDSHYMSSRALFVGRGDQNAALNWYAYQPGFAVIGKPSQKTFCITRIPYKYIFKLRKCQLPDKFQMDLILPRQVMWGETFEAVFKVRNLGATRVGRFAISFDKEWGDKYYIEYGGARLLLKDFKIIDIGILKTGETSVVKLHFIPNRPASYFWKGGKPLNVQIQDLKDRQTIFRKMYVLNDLDMDLDITKGCVYKQGELLTTLEITSRLKGISFTRQRICLEGIDSKIILDCWDSSKSAQKIYWQLRSRGVQRFRIHVNVFSGNQQIANKIYVIKNACWQTRTALMPPAKIPEVPGVLGFKHDDSGQLVAAGVKFGKAPNPGAVGVLNTVGYLNGVQGDDKQIGETANKTESIFQAYPYSRHLSQRSGTFFKKTYLIGIGLLLISVSLLWRGVSPK